MGLCGRHQAPLLAHEQAQTQVFLELRQQPAHGRLRQFQALCRTGGGAGAHDRLKRFKLPEIHGGNRVGHAGPQAKK
ncbi:hypothetical protein D3C80_2067220 [compost metagenome]